MGRPLAERVAPLLTSVVYSQHISQVFLELIICGKRQAAWDLPTWDPNKSQHLPPSE